MLRMQLRRNTEQAARATAARRQEPRGLYDLVPRVDNDYGRGPVFWQPVQECPDTKQAAAIFGSLRLEHEAPDSHDQLIKMLQRDDGAQGQKGLYRRVLRRVFELAA